jgi:hypothetical protein
MWGIGNQPCTSGKNKDFQGTGVGAGRLTVQRASFAQDNTPLSLKKNKLKSSPAGARNTNRAQPKAKDQRLHIV